MEHHLSVIAVLGVVLCVGHIAGALARRIALPSLIGYMLTGVLMGPSLLGILHAEQIESLSFITEIILGFVAFSIGAELSLRDLKKQGRGIVTIIFSESLMAFAVVALLVWLVTRDLPLALILGALAPASAPAGTVAVIQEYKARGPLTKALYAVVGFDDGLAIVIYGIAAAIARNILVAEATGGHGTVLAGLQQPLMEIVFSTVVGCVIGFVFSWVVDRLRQGSDVMILIFAAIFIGTGISLSFHLSLILTNMFIGFILSNTRHEQEVQRVSRELLAIMPLMFILFFALAGAHLHLRALPSLGLLGLVYIIGRSTGLISGAKLGATLGGANAMLRKYLGLGILSQAGVAIGLSLIVKQDFALIGSEHADKIGAAVLTTITATSIVFEVIGPICTKFALARAGEIPQTVREK